MFDIDRFKELLSGDEPKTEEEKSWIDNYRLSQSQTHIYVREQEEQEFQNYKIAYHEFYNLIKSSVPRDFFIKKPMSIAEFESVKKSILEVAYKRTEDVMNNKLLQIKYGIYPIRSDVSTQIHNGLFNFFTSVEICKKIGVSYNKLYSEYEKYNTKDLQQKIDEIRDKYKVGGIGFNFNIKYWCTDYEEFRNYKK